MHRIDSAYAVADKFGAGKDGFAESTPGVTQPTEVTDDWLDGVQEEICNVIEGNGGTLSKGTRDQLYDILRAPVGEAAGGTAIDATGGATDGTALKGTGGSGDGKGVEGVGTGTAAGVTGTGVNGYGVEAGSDTSSPAKSSLQVTPQDSDASLPAKGNYQVHTEGGKPKSYNGASMDRFVMQSYASGSDLDTVTNSTSEETFSQSYTIPADTLRSGSTIRIRAYVYVNAVAAADNLILKLKIGALTFLSKSKVAVASNFWSFDFIASIDSTGDIRSIATVLNMENALVEPVMDIAQSRAMSLGVSNDVVITAQWGAAAAGNQVSLEMLTVDVI